MDTTSLIPARKVDEGRPKRVASDPPELRRRLTVVSFLAWNDRTPRGARTQALLPALRKEWVVDVIPPDSGPPMSQGAPRPAGRQRSRRLASHVVRWSLLDRYELAARRAFGAWSPETDAALLIGFPFSPLVAAARRLRRADVPYIVDSGDPWVLTAVDPVVRGPAARRAARAERELWDSASGAIVTTRIQADRLAIVAPHLELLVRPNGVDPDDRPAFVTAGRQPRDAHILRLAHLGALYGPRLDIEPFLRTLVMNGPWSRVELHQFGSVDSVPDVPGLSVIIREPAAWKTVARLAAEFDAAIVVGNTDPAQLPSKAVAYSVLPIPRIAVVSQAGEDSLAAYVRDRSGWLVVDARAPDVTAVAAHIARDWDTDELRPGPDEGWSAAVAEIATFVRRLLAATT